MLKNALDDKISNQMSLALQKVSKSKNIQVLNDKIENVDKRFFFFFSNVSRTTHVIPLIHSRAFHTALNPGLSSLAGLAPLFTLGYET